MYNPYNSRNKLLSLKDIQTILITYKCSFNIKNLKLFQNAMIHSSYVRREEYTSPTGEIIKLVDKPDDCIDLFDESYERLEHLGDSILGAIVEANSLTHVEQVLSTDFGLVQILGVCEYDLNQELVDSIIAPQS